MNLPCFCFALPSCSIRRRSKPMCRRQHVRRGPAGAVVGASGDRAGQYKTGRR
jgi:hypothetical protein